MVAVRGDIRYQLYKVFQGDFCQYFISRKEAEYSFHVGVKQKESRLRSQNISKFAQILDFKLYVSLTLSFGNDGKNAVLIMSH